MPKKKKQCYGVIFGDGKTEIYLSWEACKKAVTNVSQVRYRGFYSVDEAEAFLRNHCARSSPPKSAAKPVVAKKSLFSLRGKSKSIREFSLYVDGSYLAGQPSVSVWQSSALRAGWAFVLLEGERMIMKESGITKLPALSRNIDGEIAAVLHGFKWFAHRFRAILPKCVLTLYFDYQGLESWLTGEWKPRSEIAFYYLRAASKYLKYHLSPVPSSGRQEDDGASLQEPSRISGIFAELLAFRFQKVRAHSGSFWNQEADRLARQALLHHLKS